MWSSSGKIKVGGVISWCEINGFNGGVVANVMAKLQWIKRQIGWTEVVGGFQSEHKCDLLSYVQKNSTGLSSMNP